MLKRMMRLGDCLVCGNRQLVDVLRPNPSGGYTCVVCHSWLVLINPQTH